MSLKRYPREDGTEVRTIEVAPGVEAITGVGAPLTSVHHAIAAILRALSEKDGNSDKQET